MGAIEKLLGTDGNNAGFKVKRLIYPNVTDKEKNGENLKKIKTAAKNAATNAEDKAIDSCFSNGAKEVESMTTERDFKQGTVTTTIVNGKDVFKEIAIESLKAPSKKRSLDPYILTTGGMNIEIYPPIHEDDYISDWHDESKDSNKQQTNNRSMIVRVVPSEENAKKDGMNALLLGDLYINGLIAAKKVYGSTIFSSANHYNVCKFGHHGLRMQSYWGKENATGIAHLKKHGASNDGKFWEGKSKNTYMELEIAFYNEYIAAQNYVFNTTYNKVNALEEEDKYEGVTDRYSQLATKGNLKYNNGNETSVCVKFGSSFKMPASGGNVISGQNNKVCDTVNEAVTK